MHPPKGRKTLKNVIKKVNENPSSVHFAVRNYVDAISSFQGELEGYRKLFSDCTIFSEFHDAINEIESSLRECVEWISDHLEGEMDYDDLMSNIKDDAAQSLDSALSNTPMIFRSVPECVEVNLDMCERMWEEFQKKGYDCYHVLIGAA